MDAACETVYIIRKDRHYRFTWCNEAFANIADLDSPSAAVGKSDEQMIWHDQAVLYRRGDHLALQGKHQGNFIEPQMRQEGLCTIMANKHPIYDKNGNIKEVMCSFTNIENVSMIKKRFAFLEDGRLSLGSAYDDAILSCREYEVLHLIFQGLKPKTIQTQLNIKKSTYDSLINRIKIKMGCATIGDILYSAIQTHLVHIL